MTSRAECRACRYLSAVLARETRNLGARLSSPTSPAAWRCKQESHNSNQLICPRERHFVRAAQLHFILTSAKSPCTSCSDTPVEQQVLVDGKRVLAKQRDDRRAAKGKVAQLVTLSVRLAHLAREHDGAHLPEKFETSVVEAYGGCLTDAATIASRSVSEAMLTSQTTSAATPQMLWDGFAAAPGTHLKFFETHSMPNMQQGLTIVAPMATIATDPNSGLSSVTTARLFCTTGWTASFSALSVHVRCGCTSEAASAGSSAHIRLHPALAETTQHIHDRSFNTDILRCFDGRYTILRIINRD